MIIDEKYFQYLQLEPCDGVRSIMDIIRAGGYSDNMSDDEREFYTAYLEWKEKRVNKLNNALDNAEQARVERLAVIKNEIQDVEFLECTPCEYEPATFSNTATIASVVEGCDYESEMLEYMSSCNKKLKANKEEIYKNIWGDNIDCKQSEEI